MQQQHHDQLALVQQLFLTHHSLLRRFVFSLLRDYAAADDVVQETFLTVTNKANDFCPDTNFFAWVTAIARLHILQIRRTNVRAARMSFRDELLEVLTKTVPEEAFDPSQALALTKCLERLPRNFQELIRLRYALGRRPAEIGLLLNRTVNSVKVGLAKARAALRTCAQRELKREGLV